MKLKNGRELFTTKFREEIYELFRTNNLWLNRFSMSSKERKFNQEINKG